MYTSTIFRVLPILVAALVPTTFAQTWSFCNPMNQTGCPNDVALGIANYSIDFTTQTMSSKVWNTTAGVIDYDFNDGAQFIIEKKLESPTIQSNFHIFFGQVEVIMLAAHGQGIVSSIVIQSDDLDEIDWEWIGGNTTHVQTNYFGKGNTTSYDRAIWHEIETPQVLYHNYTVDWQKDKTDFYIDGQIVRTLKYEDANGGKNYPQTPADVRLGIWPGGDPKNNEYTIEWAGGAVDYSKGPYTMAVKSIRVSDASTATEYHWSDRTGSMESIEIINGTKRAFDLDGNNNVSAAQSAAQRWRSLSNTAKIAIFSSVAGVLLLAFLLMVFCCIKQRRAGKRERLLADAEFEKGTAELLAFRAEMNRQRTVRMQDTKGGLGGNGFQRF